MTAIALDTNRYVDFMRGVPEAVERVRLSEKVCLPIVTLAELRAGFLCGTRSEANERQLILFLNSPAVRVLIPDEATTHQYARLYRQLRKQGTPIPAHDIWVAALVLQHNLVLFARDAHFDRLPQVPRV